MRGGIVEGGRRGLRVFKGKGSREGNACVTIEGRGHDL
jgi:hypothetical protein